LKSAKILNHFAILNFFLGDEIQNVLQTGVVLYWCYHTHQIALVSCLDYVMTTMESIRNRAARAATQQY